MTTKQPNKKAPRSRGYQGMMISGFPQRAEDAVREVLSDPSDRRRVFLALSCLAISRPDCHLGLIGIGREIELHLKDCPDGPAVHELTSRMLPDLQEAIDRGD